MHRKSLVIGLVGLALLVVLNGLAYQYFWYWYYPWADIPMHLVGGFGLSALVLAKYGGRAKWYSLVGVILLAGLGWELFEFKFSHFLPIDVMFKTLPDWERGVADTFSDILLAVLGGLLAFGWLGQKNNLTYDQKIEA